MSVALFISLENFRKPCEGSHKSTLNWCMNHLGIQLQKVQIEYRIVQHLKPPNFDSKIYPRLEKGCLPFVRINWLGRALNNGKSFSKITKPTERNGAYHLQFDFP